MKTKTSLLIAFTAIIVTALVSRAEFPPVGSAAPDFSLKDTKGQTHSVAQYKGKYIVLEWFNPECPFVKKHYGSENMQKLQQEATSKGAVWLSIDSSAEGKEGYLTADAADKIKTQWHIANTAFLLDPDGVAGKAYGAKNTPHMVIINPEGKIVYEGAIDSKATPNPNDIADATNYVKVALDEAMAGKPVSNPQTKPYGCSVKYKSM